MPWFKIDDKHHDHSKTRKALRGVKGKRRDAGAMGLWELAGSWSADNLMDGFVPTDELFRWDDNWQALADRLVDAEYWEPVEKDGEEGYQFINWDEHQPTKADVEAKREAARERMRNMRSGSRERSGAVRANSTRSDAVRSPTPSRPVPTRPVPTTEEPPLVDVPTEMDRFDEFWDAYGHKKDRATAEKKWRLALKKPGVTADLLITAAAAYVDWERANNEGGRFIMGPAKWLLNERWRDERSARATAPTRTQQHLALARQLAAEESGLTLGELA